MTAQLIHHHHLPYPPLLKASIFAIRSGGPIALQELARLGREISLTYAACFNQAFERAGIKADQVTAVAAHGQTLFHQPPNTIQWLDPALIAAQTRCQVISDFRRADCAAGGQGAPLVPFADYILFRHPEKNRILLNIGGIANLTFIPAAAKPDQLLAFDTGPGNCISDHLIRASDPAGPGFDVDGAKALEAETDWEFFEEVIEELGLYLNQPPPKSTDVPAMLAAWQRALSAFDPAPTLDEQLATAAAVTAFTIFTSLIFLNQPPYEFIISGGGAANQAIIANLQNALDEKAWPMLTSAELGIPCEAKEAIAFALLGAATLDGVPSNVPSCTGASQGVVLGSITPKPTPIKGP